MNSRRDAEFTEFVAVRLPALRRVAYLLCQDWHGADDLVQVAITRLYANWPRAAAMDHTEAYVRTIVVRQYLGERRSGWARRVASMGGALPEVVAAEPDPDLAIDLKAALTGLPPRQRATIVLRFYCDLSVSQTAEVLGCTLGTVKSQTAKALDSLRRALELAEPIARARATGPQRTSPEVGSHG
jgi:RNA polymerase sigma-70 factor (sigma-E family)